MHVMRRLRRSLLVAAAGAAVAYFLDPVEGQLRRQAVIDRARSLGDLATTEAGAPSSSVGGGATGTAATPSGPAPTGATPTGAGRSGASAGSPVPPAAEQVVPPATAEVGPTVASGVPPVASQPSGRTSSADTD
jgi:type IV secretory pathway TrbL component